MCVWLYIAQAKIDTVKQMQAIQKNITINLNGKIKTFDRPWVMGIMNITPDSFYSNSRVAHESVLIQAKLMLDQGADVLDIGGYSTRPGANEVSELEEKERVIPVIKTIINQFPDTIISIDTFRNSVAKAAIEAGACIINDVSAGEDDEKMLDTVSKLGVPYIMMHKKGNPQTMQQMAQYEDIVKETIEYLAKRIQLARKAGIKDIIVDPGFGFAKLLAHNYTLLNKLEHFKILEVPLLVGVSRKKMIQQIVYGDASESLFGTIAANTIALLKGADILRVHDVKAANDCINIVLQTKLH
jgi:dihydropteroate synthase